MSGRETLPKFHTPPVDEVAVGVQYRIPSDAPFHYSPFHDRIRRDFPRLQVVSPILPMMDSTPNMFQGIGPTGLPAMIGLGPTWPRILFISEDDSTLIQLQNDRLYFNWRKRPGSDYRSFDLIRKGFSEAYSILEDVVAQQGFGQVQPSVCEVLYVNPLTEGVTGATASQPEKVFRVCRSKIGLEWQTPLEDLSFAQRYKIAGHDGIQKGLLTASMSTRVNRENVKLMHLELIARGNSDGIGLSNILPFLDLGHEAIVSCFAAITTDRMHKRWGRFQ